MYSTMSVQTVLCNLVCLFVCTQRYGLWDHEGPMEDHSASPETFNVGVKTREGDEDGNQKAKRPKEEREDDRVSTASTLENLEITEISQIKKVGVNTRCCLVSLTGMFLKECFATFIKSCRIM